MLFTSEFLDKIEELEGSTDWLDKLMDDEELSFHDAVVRIAQNHKIEPEYFSSPRKWVDKKDALENNPFIRDSAECYIGESEAAQDLRLKIMTTSLG